MHSLVRLVMILIFLTAFVGNAVAATVDVGVSRDAQVVEGKSATNYGNGTAMYVASASGGTYLNERIWTSFDLAGQLPPGAVISSATLRLYCYKVDSDNNLPTSVHGSSDDSWGETAITWSSQPAFGAELSSTELQQGAEGQWVEWDVTSFVQTEFAGDGTVSLVLKASAEGSSDWTSYAFDAREYSSSLAPRLRIEYTGAWPVTGNFKIFHMNDVHSRLTPHELDVPGDDDTPVFEAVGGAAYFTTKLLEMKGANPDSLILDAGDMSEGNPLGDLRGNGAMIDYYNLLDTKLKALGGRGIDATVVGNHDVRSVEYVNNLKNNAQFPVISMNICHDGTLNPYFAPYQIVTVNGTKVGILGYTNDESSYMDADADALIDVVKAVWEDTDSATIDIKDYVEELRTVQGCDVVVLLSHMGQSRVVSGDDALVEDHGGVLPPEVVVSGHWHSWTETAWQPAHLNGKTLIVEAASYLQYLGEVELTGDGRYVQARKYAIRNAGLTPDSDVLALIADLETEFAATGSAYALDTVIGHSAVDLRLDKDKWWTMNEFPWSGDNTAGAWICDAMVWKASQLGHTAQLAIQSGGGVRRDVPAGPVTFGQIYETYPWQDDGMVLVQLTGQEIWDFIEGDYCGTSISKDWLVTAEDGIISAISYQGSPISLSGTYNVLVSEYMAVHETAFAGKTTTPLSGAIRQAVVDYTAQFDAANPMQVPGPRYDLDTELAGGFQAVVTMVDDVEREPYYEAVFVRLLNATAETTARREDYGLSELVNADGSINLDHHMAESMLYRSHLGFADGELQPGDIIEIWVEGGFHDGNGQLVEQSGIVADGTELLVLGHDESQAMPEYHEDIASFWDEEHENRFVTFYAEKTGDSAVRDSSGTEITVYKPGGYYTKDLPGSNGDLLMLTGVNTYDEDKRIFRCAAASLATTEGYPPSSRVDAIVPATQTAGPLLLTATASDPTGGGSSTVSASPVADAQVVEGYPADNYGTRTYLYVESAASGTYLDERSWMRFDLTGMVPDGATVTGARLKLYAWKAGSSDMPTVVHGADDDSWSETGITWDNQPTLGGQLDTVTLAAGQTGAWYSWDVTSYVQGELSGDKTASFVVKPVTEGSATTLTYAFESREWSDAVLRPVLEIDYEAPASGGMVSTIDFYYSYAVDGTNWGAWTLIDRDSAEPWQTSFYYPAGPGHYEFYSVATDAEGNVEPTPVTADAQVLFSPPYYDLTVSLSGTGGGQVSYSSGGTCSDSCINSFVEGTMLILTANPDSGADFDSWSGCDAVDGAECTITMSGDRTVTATFSEIVAAEPVPSMGFAGLLVTVAGLFLGTTLINKS